MRVRRDRLGALATIALLVVQSGCMPLEPGESGVQAELDRRQGETGFAVLSASPARTVIAAKGRQVTLAPGDGFCVAMDSVETSDDAAFALVSDCAARADSFPGVITVSIAGTPLAEAGSSTDAALEELEVFLAGEGGRALLGRGSDSRDVSVMATRRVGDGLYVLVDDRGAGPLPQLDGRFWRAFVDLGGRMCMVTLSGFRHLPVADDEMLAFLVRQVVALRQANRSAASADELELAGAVAARYTLAARGGQPASDPAGPTAAAPLSGAAAGGYAVPADAASAYRGPAATAGGYAGPDASTGAPSDAERPASAPSPAAVGRAAVRPAPDPSYRPTRTAPAYRPAVAPEYRGPGATQG